MIYPTKEEILIRWQKAGSHICVIVEGETELEDAWFYEQWFGGYARKVTFFPQNGWQKVVEVVVDLRQILGNKTVYGIIDRDFQDSVQYDSIPVDGIVRTPKYTLENYLLDPSCWYEVIRPLNRRRPNPDWQTVEQVKSIIENLYRTCIPISAHNWMILHISSFVASDVLIQYKWTQFKESPEGLPSDLSTHWKNIQTQLNLDTGLAELYQERENTLNKMSLAELEKVVSGKYVLKQLQRNFPINLSGREAWDNVVGAYIEYCSEPPSDLEALIQAIIRDSHT
ncbi:MAG: DUF4435 domain-containing protein [Chloroflexota bacterium]